MLASKILVVMLESRTCLTPVIQNFVEPAFLVSTLKSELDILRMFLRPVAFQDNEILSLPGANVKGPLEVSELRILVEDSVPLL